MIQQSVSATPPLSGVLEQFSKRQTASANPTTFLLVKQTYSDAIEYTGTPVGSRGLLLFFTLISSAFLLKGSQQILTDGVTYDPIGIVDIVGIIVAVTITSLVTYGIAISIRLELFRPLDEPFIFDRKNRKVYLNYRQVSLNWRGLLRRWPCKTDIYDWDLIHAEHHAVVNANSATVSRAHSLVFVVHQSKEDPTVIAQFAIGGIQMGEVSVPAVWEHIRRFMEENGPHVPAGEPLMQVQPPTSLWQILSNMGPYGKPLPTWWRIQKVMTIFAFIFAPILVPGCIVFSICAWISYKTAFSLPWPQEVLDAVGRPIFQT